MGIETSFTKKATIFINIAIVFEVGVWFGSAYKINFGSVFVHMRLDR